MLRTHPAVGSLTALAFVLIIGRADRFQSGKQIASYLGLVPLEESSGDRRRLGHITKKGNSLLRFLLVEAAQVTVRSLPSRLITSMEEDRACWTLTGVAKLGAIVFWFYRRQQSLTFENQLGRGLTFRDYSVNASRTC
jgi:transposase